MEHPVEPGLTNAEIEQEAAVELPKRQAMSLINTDPSAAMLSGYGDLPYDQSIPNADSAQSMPIGDAPIDADASESTSDGATVTDADRSEQFTQSDTATAS